MTPGNNRGSRIGVIAPLAFTEVVVGDLDAGDRTGVEAIIHKNGIAAAAKVVVVYDDVRNITKIVVNHYSTGLTIIIDNRVVPDSDIRYPTAIYLKAVIMRVRSIKE